MNWRALVRKWIILLMIFCLLGTIAQACEEYEKEEICYEKEEKVIVEEEVEPQVEPESDITESKWLIILSKLIERYPIIEKIIDWIFKWIFNNLLDMNY
ncbi:hypothetical protein AYK24_06975 [Thermoplasmatales archaeon SG8-52-4]|nr:MAG: hypothetical protein AYK24_06975 [Thermoplasmatales archaeon SG8-52-4]